MDDLIKDLEDAGFEVVVGWKDKERKKTIKKALEKLKERGDENKLKIAKKLDTYFKVFNIMDAINFFEIPSEEDKYRVNLMREYLEINIEDTKICLSDVMKALGDDEPLDSYSENLLFNFLYTPDELKELGFKNKK